MDYTVQIDLPDHKRGDAWQGIALIGPIEINGGTPGENLSRVRMHFRLDGSHRVFALDSDDGDITILNPVDWTAKIPEIAKFLPVAGSWVWDMEFYKDGEVAPLTIYKGAITVHDDITK